MVIPVCKLLANLLGRFSVILPEPKEMDNKRIGQNLKTVIHKGKCTKLHDAVQQNSLENLELLLRQKSIDLNNQNRRGETAFMLSLRKLRNDFFIKRLLDAGCDVNIPNKRKQSALHLAVCRFSNYIVLQLIKRGLDINAQDSNGLTPLHYAVYNNMEESVSILLYYGADVNILDQYNSTPFMTMKKGRISQYNIVIAQILIDYYDQFPDASMHGYVGGILSVKNKSKKFAELLFKFWQKIDFGNYDCSFLLWHCIINRSFSTNDWIRCVYLAIESCLTDNFIGDICNQYLFTTLLCSFYARKIPQLHRMPILWACLSLGIYVNVDDIRLAHQLFGFSREVEMLIYSVDVTNKIYSINFPLSTFILAFDQIYSIDNLFQLFKNQITVSHYEQIETEYIRGISFFHLISPLDVCNKIEQYLKDSLKYFSLPLSAKQKLAKLCLGISNNNNRREIVKEIEKVPELPSLVEICRNQVRIYVMQTYHIKYPYELHEVVENLYLPREVKEIIRFKRPIYQ